MASKVWPRVEIGAVLDRLKRDATAEIERGGDQFSTALVGRRGNRLPTLRLVLGGRHCATTARYFRVRLVGCLIVPPGSALKPNFTEVPALSDEFHAALRIV